MITVFIELNGVRDLVDAIDAHMASNDYDVGSGLRLTNTILNHELGISIVECPLEHHFDYSLLSHHVSQLMAELLSVLTIHAIPDINICNALVTTRSGACVLYVDEYEQENSNARK
jgi:hypothetical protein